MMWSRMRCSVMMAALCCVSGQHAAFTLDLKYSGHPASVDIPTLSTELSEYAYATEEALVAIPVKCVTLHLANLTARTTLNDRQPGGPTGMAYLRVSEIEGGYAALKAMSSCARGLVLNLHGTGGPGWGTVAYAAMMSGMGYLVLNPDSQAMPEDRNLKGRTPLPASKDIPLHNYCGSLSKYGGSCYGFNKPMCYSSKFENIVNNSVNYQKYVDTIYTIRKLELDYFVDQHMDFVNLFSKVFLIGNSEGGMVATKYHNGILDAKLSGRIIAAYACDYNYFNSGGDNAKICGDSCNKAVPQLNVIGTNDGYFGRKPTSMASRVASATGGYGGPITGNCHAAYSSQEFTKATTVEFIEGSHGPMYTHESSLRSVFADFLEMTEEADSDWPSLAACSKVGGVYECENDGPQFCNLDDWVPNEGVPWTFKGTTPFNDYAPQCPAVGGGDDTFVLNLPAHEKNVSVPPVPTTLSQFAYASEEALVAVPLACLPDFSSNFMDHAILNDTARGPTGMAYLRISEITGGYDTLKKMKVCARGLILNLHGTGGPGWGTVAYAAMMSGMGYLVLNPDSQAMPESMGMKGRTPLEASSDIPTHNYCGSLSKYGGSCYGFNKPMCYSSKDGNMVGNGDGYRKYVERIYTIRKRELDYFVDRHMDFVNLFSKVFIIGNSEGGMVATKYHNEHLDAKLTGRIIAGYACDFNYFNACAEHAKICGDMCDKAVPQLNVIGTNDGYFGRKPTTMSRKVADPDGGYGGPITGNCHAAFTSQKFTKATTVEFEEGSHGPMYTHESELRSVFADFLEKTDEAASTWGSLQACSQVADGLFSCTRAGDQFCSTQDWVANMPLAPWSFTGTKPWDLYPQGVYMTSSQCVMVPKRVFNQAKESGFKPVSCK